MACARSCSVAARARKRPGVGPQPHAQGADPAAVSQSASGEVVAGASEQLKNEDRSFHLVHDEPLIQRNHDEEFPPDEYYIRLRDVLAVKFPGATPELLDHTVPLVVAFGMASAFAMGVGVAKFQLAQAEVKLVGEIVGREGCSPNPELVTAVRIGHP